MQPYSNPRSVSTDKFEKVLDAISALSIEDIIEDDPADLSKYGLDDPHLN